VSKKRVAPKAKKATTPAALKAASRAEQHRLLAQARAGFGEACARAKRQWGPKGGTAFYASEPDPHRRYCVGLGGPIFTIAGLGDSWDAAFEDADRQFPPATTTGLFQRIGKP
jgi:hypothetical protein